ncbi:MAG: VWA domain-containing protein [Thermosphaera sp.]
MDLINNLTNVTVRNPAFTFWARRVAQGISIPPELSRWAEQLKIAAGDTFFIYYSLFPQLRDANPDPLLNAVLEIVKNHVKEPEFRAARTRTVYNDFLSSLLARRFLIHLIAEIREQLEQLPPPPSPPSSGSGPQQGAGEGSAGGGQQQQGQQGTQQQGQEEGEGPGCLGIPLPFGGSCEGGLPLPPGIFHQAVKKALREAEKDAQDASDLPDLCSGVGKTPAPLERLLDLAEKVLGVSWAREVLALAREIQTPQFVHLVKEKERRGEEIAGFRRTLRLDRALPRELALDDDIFYAKLASGGLLSREYYVSREGAYYVLIDRSGSMSGEKTIWARSVALALFKLARAKRRKFFLRFFDVKVHPPPEQPPILQPEDVVEHILSVVSTGGTSIDNALSTAIADLEKGFKELTNTIVIITDGEDRVSTRPDQIRAVGARLIAVMIQGRNEELRQLALATGGEYLHATLDPRGGGLVVRAAER